MTDFAPQKGMTEADIAARVEATLSERCQAASQLT
jgi:hypothetical protein